MMSRKSCVSLLGNIPALSPGGCFSRSLPSFSCRSNLTVWVEVLCAFILLGVLATRRNKATVVCAATLLGVAIGLNSALTVRSPCRRVAGREGGGREKQGGKDEGEREAGREG